MFRKYPYKVEENIRFNRNTLYCFLKEIILLWFRSLSLKMLRNMNKHTSTFIITSALKLYPEVQNTTINFRNLSFVTIPSRHIWHIGLLHLKFIHPLWKNLKKCTTGGVQICKCTCFLSDF